MCQCLLTVAVLDQDHVEKVLFPIKTSAKIQEAALFK